MASACCHLPLGHPPVIDATAIGWGTHGSAGTFRTRVSGSWTLNAYPYAAAWRIAGRTYALRPGCFALTPPGMISEYRFAEPCSHFYVLFSCPEGPATDLPYLIDAGPRAGDLLARLELAKASLPANPPRASSLLWSVLWEYAECAGALPSPAPATTVVDRAREVLEKRLFSPSLIRDVAADLGISARHLQRLFRDRYGCSIRHWQSQRQGERLRRLLATTDLPMQAVAGQLGVGSLQQLNKLSRRILGASPRTLREQAGASPTKR